MHVLTVIIATLLAVASITLAQNTNDTRDKSIIPDTVDLEKLEIRTEFQCTKTTDTQGRFFESVSDS